jgi:hypothetical protein
MIDSTGELIPEDKKIVLPMKSSNIQPNGLRLQRLFHGLCALSSHLDTAYLDRAPLRSAPYKLCSWTRRIHDVYYPPRSPCDYGQPEDCRAADLLVSIGTRFTRMSPLVTVLILLTSL